MKKSAYTLFAILLTLSVSPVSAQYTILSERDTVVKAKLEGITLGSRPVRHIIYEYPSVDPDGNVVTASGVIVAPSDIVEGDVPADGIIMFNHYTLGDPEDRPTADGKSMEAISALVSNPLKPNYIVVASDYIGYGSSASHQVAYLCGDTNARNSLDGLLAARQLMDDKQIPQGKYLFNVGYSQGGTETMYAAKLTDMVDKYKGIRFDKSFSGGGLLDYETAYDEYITQDKCDAIKDVVAILISINENCHLGIDYATLFKEPMASKVAEFIEKKDKDVMNEAGLGDMEYLHEVLQPAYMDLNSDEVKRLKAKMKQIGVMEGWEPDVTKQYYIEHSRHDNYVPIQASRGIVPWMQEKGFTPSLVPGKTPLQTTLVVFSLDHHKSGIVWTIQTMAAIQFWPVLYYEGEQNRYYREIFGDMNLMKVIKTLEGWGLDLKKLLKDSGVSLAREAADYGCTYEDIVASFDQASDTCSLARSPRYQPRRWTMLDLIPNISETLAKVNLTTDDLEEMLLDSGITIEDVLQAFVYLMLPSDSAREADDYMAPIEERVEAPLFLLRSYEQKLAAWYMLAGIDVNYGLWGN